MNQPLTPAWGPVGDASLTVTHGRVSLRPIRRRDAKPWLEIHERNQRWLAPWEATIPPGPSGGQRPSSFGAMAADLRRQMREGRIVPWMVWYDPVAEGSPRRSWVLAGQVTVASIARGSAQWAQVGYWIDERWAGRGITPLAVALATDHCLGPLGLHRVEIVIRPENTNSIRVVEKLGLREEGFRPRYLHIDGDWRDHVVYAVHDDELEPGGLVGRLGRAGRLQGLD